MEEKNFVNLLKSSFDGIWEMMIEKIPYVFSAIGLLLIGWLAAKILSWMIFRILKLIKFDAISDKLNISNSLQKANIRKTPSRLLSKILYYVLLLFVLLSVSKSMGWTSLADSISSFLNVIPKLFIGLSIFAIGAYISKFVRDLVSSALISIGISSGRILAIVIYYFLMAIVLVTSLDQMGMDTTIITSNILIILGAIFISAAISYGFASKDILTNILASYAGRNTFKKGMVIELDGIKGKIIDVSNLGLTLESSSEKIIIPMKTIINSNVKIHS